jgi:hypothetical protein
MPKGKKKLSKEKRLHPRFSAEIPVKYWVLEEQKAIESFLEHLEKTKSAKTKDVSLGGMYISTGHTLKKGSILQLEIMIPCHKEKLKTYAEVVWTNEFGGGLKFFMLSDDDRKCLKSYLEKYFSL